MANAGSGDSWVDQTGRPKSRGEQRTTDGGKPSGPLEAPPRSILVVMLSAVGDAVQVLPVLCALRRSFPQTHISWVVQPGPLSLVAGHPAVDRFISFERGDRTKLLRSVSHGLGAIRETARRIRRVADELPGGRFDLVLDLQVYLKAGLLTSLAPARLKLGFDLRRARDLNWLFTTLRIPPHPQRFGHIQDQYFEFLRFLGVDPEPLEYGLGISAKERRSQREFFSSLSRSPCALVLASSDGRKDWPPERYVRILRELRSRFELQPLLVGGSSPREEKAARFVLDRAGNDVIDARGGGLRRLLWLLDGSALVISPDTGPLHMAHALGVPVVGLYGSTNPKRSGPYRQFHELVVDGYARFPGEEYPVDMERRPGGMDRITPDMVLEKVALALGRREP